MFKIVQAGDGSAVIYRLVTNDQDVGFVFAGTGLTVALIFVHLTPEKLKAVQKLVLDSTDKGTVVIAYDKDAVFFCFDK